MAWVSAPRAGERMDGVQGIGHDSRFGTEQARTARVTANSAVALAASSSTSGVLAL